MGTNYYFLTKDKALVQEYFARKTDYGIEDKEYKLIDDLFAVKWNCSKGAPKSERANGQ